MEEKKEHALGWKIEFQPRTVMASGKGHSETMNFEIIFSGFPKRSEIPKQLLDEHYCSRKNPVLVFQEGKTLHVRGYESVLYKKRRSESFELNSFVPVLFKGWIYQKIQEFIPVYLLEKKIEEEEYTKFPPEVFEF